jgi:hypothetical protein
MTIFLLEILFGWMIFGIIFMGYKIIKGNKTRSKK